MMLKNSAHRLDAAEAAAVATVSISNCVVASGIRARRWPVAAPLITATTPRPVGDFAASAIVGDAATPYDSRAP